MMRRAGTKTTRVLVVDADVTAFTTDDTGGADAVVLKQLLGDGLADTIRHVTGSRNY